VFTCDPELSREIVSQHGTYHKPPSTKHLHPRGEGLSERKKALQRWGAGLFNFNGEEHKRHRRLLQPAFHRKRIESYCADMIAITDDVLRAWQPGAVRDVRSDMMLLTLRIAAKTLLGETVVERGEGGIGELIQRAIGMLMRPSVFLLPVDVPGTPYHHFLDVVYETDRRIQRTIAAKRARGADEEDLLSTLIQARDEDGSTLSEEHLIEHASVLFIAGHETASSSLTWILFLLSQHPAVAADLLDELDGKLRGAAPTFDLIAELPLLDAVVKEGMRILPAVPLNTRIVGEPTELRGQPLGVGTTVVMSIYHTHRIPELYPRPSAFDPRRWETIHPNAYEYTPFSAGPRTCIGAQFAMTEIKIVLAMLLQRFRVELIPGTRVDRAVSITMSVKGALPMRIEARDRRSDRVAGGVVGDVREMVDLPP
jgi:cytochrome P450